MIKGITQSGRYIAVTNGNASTYVNGYSGLQGVGNMRYNTANQNMEVFDGNNWVQLGMSYATVGLNGEAESLLDWAREQRNKQLAYEAMSIEHPAVKNAFDTFKRAEEQLDLVYKLSKDYEKNDHGVTTSP